MKIKAVTEFHEYMGIKIFNENLFELSRFLHIKVMKFYTITCLYIDYTIMQIKKKTIDVFWLLVERNWAKLIVFCQEKTLKHSVLFVSSWGINLYWSIQNKQ